MMRKEGCGGPHPPLVDLKRSLEKTQAGEDKEGDKTRGDERLDDGLGGCLGGFGRGREEESHRKANTCGHGERDCDDGGLPASTRVVEWRGDNRRFRLWLCLAVRRVQDIHPLLV